MPFVVGIDGGGSGTTGVLASPDGSIVTMAAAGPSNFQAVGEDAALASVSAVLTALLAGAGIAATDLVAVAAGLAGLHTAQDRAHFGALISALVPESTVTICTDADLALASTVGTGIGIAVIAGTGSIAVGRNQDGEAGRSGGWGYLIGDEGSAYALALRGLQAASHGLDGRSPHSTLAEAFAQALGVGTFDALLRPLYGPPPFTRQQIAQLAPLVSRCAADGDAAARRVLAQAGEALAAMVVAVAVRLRFTDQPFVVGRSGGVWQAGPLLEDPFRTRILQEFPAVHVGPPTLTPAAGAAFLALTAGAASASPEEIWQRLGHPHTPYGAVSTQARRAATSLPSKRDGAGRARHNEVDA